MNVIEIRNLQKTYKNFSLTIDKLDIPEGYITGFIGPNGSGKTTTIKSLLGMTKLDSGEIKILNSDINKDTKTKEYIAYVGDESGFLEESKISSLHKIISKFYSNWDEDLYKKYINKFKINEDKEYKSLSKGQKKQFELIMALSHHPKLLIMDEPTSSLDPIIRNEFLELMQEHIDMDNMTVFYSTHITTDLDKSADYIIMIYNGKILLVDEKDSILNNHVIVKSKKELVDNSIKKEFISLKEYAFGFEGLISDKNKAYELFGDEAVYEKCTLEDILLYYTRRDS
ncbi:ABC transporter ATP-binding protein [Clostridium celatum]|uniref:ABC transporter, ATP-binding protein n=1 Tax=Clostridium celatum DSM 1785 TaxID=545697 RepID=L1QLT7_9CLOT|nr:ABC transporter ATP-binding protein [Clostridium celatum]EKY28891.1 ABC transporter, ATP-binding protein [Clostridium celatum DSM 1785]MCE9655035.1 ABC transporter ATP-binding protein [Clostridium celatum]MDU2266478.1 ABC transporter ATP-binding protein [Clostridium celatum]MDU6296762.1 ABC transporter ATP-binding protein [Clostridium celatum]